jgi:hypothetical protein
MTPAEIEAALQAAFSECETEGCPLDVEQQQVILRSLTRFFEQSSRQNRTAPSEQNSNALSSVDFNPLDQLTSAQRRTLLLFIQEQNRQNRSWKAQLLNDWLRQQDSGAIQFVRELYGMQWLEQVQPIHIAQYADEVAMMLKVGDRIEVSNSLWEWVQADGPCSQEWFGCTVVSISESSEPAPDASYGCHTNCTIRFDNGMEYEIQGVYEWNQYNWRWRGEKEKMKEGAD